jgi:hypothetical protein
VTCTAKRQNVKVIQLNGSGQDQGPARAMRSTLRSGRWSLSMRIHSSQTGPPASPDHQIQTSHSLTDHPLGVSGAGDGPRSHHARGGLFTVQFTCNHVTSHDTRADGRVAPECFTVCMVRYGMVWCPLNPPSVCSGH